MLDDVQFNSLRMGAQLRSGAILAALLAAMAFIGALISATFA
jgi:hypothetical protein